MASICPFFYSTQVAYLQMIDDNKTKIAKSGALVPLTRLARSKDMRVQRNATGALLNMTHSGMQKELSL
jgi:vacuolar protein 8